MLKLLLPRFRHASALVLLTLSLLVVGCGDSREDYVFTGTGNNPAVGNTLTVSLDTSAPAVNGRIVAAATSFDVTVYNTNLTEVTSQTVNRGASATFSGLPDGTYIVRVIGLDADGDAIGYFDRRITIDTDATVTVEGLIYTTTIPPIGSTEDPFLVFTELPDSITGGSDFDVEVTAYSADGAVLTAADGTVSLTANGQSFQTPPQVSTFQNGVARFPDLSFAQGSTGAVSFTATSQVFGNTTSASVIVGAGQPAYSRLAVGRLAGPNNPDAFTGSAVVRAPDAVLSGPSTGLIAPQGITLLR